MDSMTAALSVGGGPVPPRKELQEVVSRLFSIRDGEKDQLDLL